MSVIAFCAGVIAGGASAAFYITLRIFTCFIRGCSMEHLDVRLCGGWSGDGGRLAILSIWEPRWSFRLSRFWGWPPEYFVGAYIARIAEVLDALGAANDMKIPVKAFLLSFVIGKLFGSILYWIWF